MVRSERKKASSAKHFGPEKTRLWIDYAELLVLHSLETRGGRWVPENEVFKQAYRLWDRGYVDGKVLRDEDGYDVGYWRINKKGLELLEKGGLQVQPGWSAGALRFLF